MKASLN